MHNNNKSLAKWIVIAITVLGIFAGICVTWGKSDEKIKTIEKKITDQSIDYTNKYNENRVKIQQNAIKLQEVELKAMTALVRIDTKLENMSKNEARKDAP